jgi:hypothetical protein
MFQNRRTVFLFICSLVFVQALYYIVTLQIKKNQPTIINPPSLASITYNQSSDRQLLPVQKPQPNTINSTLTPVSFVVFIKYRCSIEEKLLRTRPHFLPIYLKNRITR